MNSAGHTKNTDLTEKVCFSVNIDLAIRDGLDKLANARKRSRSAIVNDALKDFIKTAKLEKK